MASLIFSIFIALSTTIILEPSCEQGTQAINNQKVDEAILIWRKRGDPTDMISQYSAVAICLYEAEPYQEKQDFEDWLIKMANQGNSEAQFLLGLHYFREGKKYKESVLLWVNKAMDQGHQDAKYLFGVLHMGDKWVREDFPYAMQLLHDAADNGSIIAQDDLSGIYGEGDLDQPIDVEKSKFWKEKAIATAVIVGWTPEQVYIDFEKKSKEEQYGDN